MISGNSTIRDNKINKTLGDYQLLELNIKTSLKIGLKLNEIVKIINKSVGLVLRHIKLNNKFSVKLQQQHKKFEGGGGGGGSKVAYKNQQNLGGNFNQKSNASPGVQQETKNILVFANVLKTILIIIVIGSIYSKESTKNHSILKEFNLNRSQINYIIMQLFQIKFGSPLIVWRVKPEPGD